MVIFEGLQAFLRAIATPAVYLGFAASFFIGLVLVLTKRWHGVVSMDLTDGIQKFHLAPTPRIGGIPIILSLLMVWSQDRPDIRDILAPILLAGMPAFLFGIAEDFTKSIGVLPRLIATFASGVLAWWITDYSLSRLNIWGLDYLMQFTIISVLITSFAVGGIANAINIIDGFNGLAILTCIFAFMGFALIAFKVGDIDLALVATVLAASAFGLFWINWPFGKIFLGDGGAYFLGFTLAWVAVLLIERNNSVSAFAALLVCIFPITEVLLSIFRRRLRKIHPGQPDRSHFHSMLQRRYISRWLSNSSLLTRNSVTGFLIALLSLLSTTIATAFFESTLICFFYSFFLSFCYVVIYNRMVRGTWFF
jgi:UDP-N-acetylmuramyl pentapeptide phosphotransferase/UDP-N-acetylglucosamine-1-phosphate transferase